MDRDGHRHNAGIGYAGVVVDKAQDMVNRNRTASKT